MYIYQSCNFEFEICPFCLTKLISTFFTEPYEAFRS